MLDIFSLWRSRAASRSWQWQCTILCPAPRRTSSSTKEPTRLPTSGDHFVNCILFTSTWKEELKISTCGHNLRAEAHQRYWRYEYSGFTKLEFDSYMVQEEDQQTRTFRLLDTDKWIVLPTNSPIRIIVTAADVLHSWTVSRLVVKTKATSGRLNQMIFSINRPGILYGKCSEICGARLISWNQDSVFGRATNQRDIWLWSGARFLTYQND